MQALVCQVHHIYANGGSGDGMLCTFVEYVKKRSAGPGHEQVYKSGCGGSQVGGKRLPSSAGGHSLALIRRKGSASAQWPVGRDDQKDWLMV